LNITYAVALREKHAGHFMMYNLSEQAYDYAKFDNSFLEFKFPGYPAPPLDRLFGLCNAIFAWLSADPANVAVVHCQTGNGRTVTVVACYLAWSKEFETPAKALAHIAKVRGVDATTLVIPTQLRYLSYVSWVLDGRMPSTKPITLDRVIMHGIPKIEVDGRCRPYLQVLYLCVCECVCVCVCVMVGVAPTFKSVPLQHHTI
jgi:tensin